jgi:CheY-like chemotaxis protein
VTGPADVLVVDDDADIRTMLGYALGRDLAVRFASSGSEAIEALAEQAPAAMVLDLMMPGIDGYDVLEVRRERGLAPDTCVIVLSGLAAEGDLVRSWALGADAHLAKPIDPELLLAKLQAHLASVRAR